MAVGVVGKILGCDSQHRSRFHTRRGEVASPGQLAELPGVVVRRVLRLRREPLPWLAPAAVRHLRERLHGTSRVLELGAGDSTLWYAAHAGFVRSLEPDHAWADQITRRLGGLRERVDLVRSDLRETLSTALAEPYDLVVVDHGDLPDLTRVDALERVVAAPTPPAVVVLDDSDRAEYARAAEVMRGWRATAHRGFRATPLRLTETTVFERV